MVMGTDLVGKGSGWLQFKYYFCSCFACLQYPDSFCTRLYLRSVSIIDTVVEGRIIG